MFLGVIDSVLLFYSWLAFKLLSATHILAALKGIQAGLSAIGATIAGTFKVYANCSRNNSATDMPNI